VAVKVFLLTDTARLHCLLVSLASALLGVAEIAEDIIEFIIKIRRLLWLIHCTMYLLNMWFQFTCVQTNPRYFSNPERFNL